MPSEEVVPVFDARLSELHTAMSSLLERVHAAGHEREAADIQAARAGIRAHGYPEDQSNYCHGERNFHTKTAARGKRGALRMQIFCLIIATHHLPPRPLLFSNWYAHVPPFRLVQERLLMWKVKKI